jgi:hypothetical protein
VAALGVALAAGGCERPAAREDPPLPDGPPVIHPTDSPATILEHATRAHGGAGRLARWRCGRVKYETRSDLIPLLTDKPRTVEEFYELPGKYKRLAVVGQGSRQTTVTFLVKGDQGWEYQPDGTLKLLPPAALAGAFRLAHGFADFCDLARLRDPAFRVTVLGEDTVAGRSVVVLHAEAPGINPVDYAFDRVTALLLRTTRHLPQSGGPETTVETDLAAYRDVGGAPVPLHVVGRSEGKVLLDLAILEIEFADHYDESVFTPPDS